MSKTTDFQNVNFRRLFADYDRNFRQPELYHTDPKAKYDPNSDSLAESTPGLYEDIEANGVLVPLIVSKISKERLDTYKDSFNLAKESDLLVLCGHRRLQVVQKINAKNPQNPLIETVPVIIHHDLSSEQELMVMSDQANFQEYNEFELFLQIRQLTLNTSLSEQKIGERIGKGRTYVQRRKWLLTFPQFVQEEFRKAALGIREDKKKSVKLTDKVLIALNNALKKDHDRGIESDSSDSEFMETWNLFVDGKSADGPKPLTKAQLVEKTSFVHDPILKSAFQVAQGESVDLKSNMDSLAKLRDKAKLADSLREENDKLKAEIKTLRAEIERLSEAKPKGKANGK